MVYKDYYTILGLKKTAAAGEVKKAYRSLAKKFHPDKTKGNAAAEDRFKEINEANEVLSDPAKRKKYDQFGAEWKHYEESGGRPGGFDWSKYAGGAGAPRTGNGAGSDGSSGDVDINDLFEALFGQRSGQGPGGRSVPRRGEDLGTEATLTLDEAYRGATRLVQVNSQTIKITINPGVEDGQMLRIAGKGRPGAHGGESGDLYLTVRIGPHKEYRRNGDDLHCEVNVDLYTAILGGKTTIRTFKNSVSIAIPKGIANGKELSLRGLGMPVYAKKNEYGNLFVKVNISLPEHLTEAEENLFRTLAGMRSHAPS